MKRIHLIISGIVQGVGFRYYTRKEALRIGITGYVRNTNDGSVEVEAEGTPENIERFLEWIKHGPPHARVESVRQNEMPPANEKDFLIKE